MSQVINLKRKRRWVGRREIVVMVSAVILTSVGIKAADRAFGPETMPSQRLINGCPSDMAPFNLDGQDLCVDRYEAAAGPDCPAASPGTLSDSIANLNVVACRPVSEPGRLPWRHISQDQAVQACAKAGKRLPTAQEWHTAALGTPDPLSGWGSNDCNVNGNWENKPGATGSGADCVSSAGAYDMIGNVWEWVKGAAQDGTIDGRVLPASGYVQSTDGQSWPAETDRAAPSEQYRNDYFWIKETGYRAVARGGYWGNGADAGLYSMYIVSTPAEVGQGIGFRCVK